MITCHDLGRHLGCYGVETVHTPNLDRLAGRGLRFENVYSTSAVCSPARASLHTGRYPQSNGMMGLTHAPLWWSLNDDEQHTAQILSAAGWQTYLIGFNHISSDTARLGYEHALSQRFEAAETVQATRELLARADATQRPFFAKVGFTEVHRPFHHGRDDSRGVFVPGYLRDTPPIREDLAAFQATIRAFDGYVGEILDALDASPVARETLVVFTSDHGIAYPGAKWTCRRAGLEVPLILHQPQTGLSGGRTIEALMSHVDILPTLLDVLGVPVPPRVQGMSFAGLLRGETTDPPRREAFGQYTTDIKRDNLSRCVLTDRYQLIRYFDAGRPIDYPVNVDPQRFAWHLERCAVKGDAPLGMRPFAQLFDLREDPWELNDLSGEPTHRRTLRELSRRLLAWMREVNDPLLKGPLRTPYYDRALEDLLET
jgi:arylsulfatase A-like enzyme